MTSPPVAMQSVDSRTPVLLLIGSGDRRYREYILAAVARRYRLWLLDADEPTWQSAYVERSTVVDQRNFAALLHAAGPVASAYPVAGVFSYDESMVHSAALLAEALGLPGSPPETVLACRDKATTRRILTAAGVPQPRCRPVATARDAQRAADAIGYPVVVKARGLAGSLGVVRADRPDDVAAAFRAAATADYPGVPRYQDDVLVEEFLTGPEISIDAVVAGGECVPTIVARKSTGLEPFFEETGHTVDADDPLLHDAELRVNCNRSMKRWASSTALRTRSSSSRPPGLDWSRSMPGSAGTSSPTSVRWPPVPIQLWRPPTSRRG